MASISKVFVDAIKESVTTNPLHEKEVRKIPCLGSYYVSLLSQVEEREPLVHVNVDGQEVYLYRIPK